MVYLVDDKSIFSVYSKFLLEKSCKNLLCISPKDFVKLHPNELVLNEYWLPMQPFRVYNVNFVRCLNSRFGSPYWVHIRSDLTEQLNKYFFKINLKKNIHILEYDHTNILFNQSYKSWLLDKDNIEPHNDRIERKVLKIILEQNGITNINLYETQIYFSQNTLIDHLVDELKIKVNNLKYKHYPLHRIYKKFFNKDIQINLLERSIYGEVD